MRATAAILLVLCLLALSHAWDCQELVDISNLMQIDAGLGQVVATDTSQIPYYLVGDKWIRLPGSLKHITVGPAGIWGVNKADSIYKYVAGNWMQAAGLLKQVDAGGVQFIVGRYSILSDSHKGPDTPSMDKSARKCEVLQLWTLWVLGSQQE
ncbi:fish-egg lectin-like [Oncorhynchus masou masou]|uniref:fish-egg lectin-like n=1 Tax=Oncorhynchus masou masou TaxID=90313 RepID=UPI0031839969